MHIQPRRKRMRARNTVFLLGFLALIVAVELVEELWLSQPSAGGSDTFPPWISSWDSSLFVLINQSFSIPILDLFMSIVTHGGSTVFWLVVAFLLWFYDRRREAVLLAVSIILGGALFLFLKFFIDRPRPYQVIAGSRVLTVEGGSSFPSGHSKNVFSAAVILGKSRAGRWRVLLYAFAVVVSLSRIYVGLHYPFDTLVGALAGYVIAKITLRYERQIVSLTGRYLPLAKER
jgi:undecaprenyl-diphosphatase